jgi:hypothetical protein
MHSGELLNQPMPKPMHVIKNFLGLYSAYYASRTLCLPPLGECSFREPSLAPRVSQPSRVLEFVHAHECY